MSCADTVRDLQTASDGTVPEGRAGRARAACGPACGAARAPARDDLPPLARSKRSNTISVMSPTRRHRCASQHFVYLLVLSGTAHIEQSAVLVHRNRKFHMQLAAEILDVHKRSILLLRECFAHN